MTAVRSLLILQQIAVCSHAESPHWYVGFPPADTWLLPEEFEEEVTLFSVSNPVCMIFACQNNCVLHIQINNFMHEYFHCTVRPLKTMFARIYKWQIILQSGGLVKWKANLVLLTETRLNEYSTWLHEYALLMWCRIESVSAGMNGSSCGSEWVLKAQSAISSGWLNSLAQKVCIGYWTAALTRISVTSQMCDNRTIADNWADWDGTGFVHEYLFTGIHT